MYTVYSTQHSRPRKTWPEHVCKRHARSHAGRKTFKKVLGLLCMNKQVSTATHPLHHQVVRACATTQPGAGKTTPQESVNSSPTLSPHHPTRSRPVLGCGGARRRNNSLLRLPDMAAGLQAPAFLQLCTLNATPRMPAALEQVMQAHIARAEAHLRQDGGAQQRHELPALVQDERQAVRVACEHLQLHMLLRQQLRLRGTVRQVCIMRSRG